MVILNSENMDEAWWSNVTHKKCGIDQVKMDENVDSSAISLQSAEYVRKRRRGIYQPEVDPLVNEQKLSRRGSQFSSN